MGKGIVSDRQLRPGIRICILEYQVGQSPASVISIIIDLFQGRGECNFRKPVTSVKGIGSDRFQAFPEGDDIIDSRSTDIAVAEEFITEVLKIAPVYYVTGNHESRVTSFDGLLSFMENAGVVVAENKSIRLYRGNASITVCGISDPNFTAGDFQGYEEAVVDTSLGKLTRNEDFTVLLSHHPEFFELYVQHGFELVLSGHAHGGQFRLPFVGGFIAPGQGLFPEYDSGLYREKGTSMIVSRGLGNSIIPLRFNNRPEIILITLKEEA